MTFFMQRLAEVLGAEVPMTPPMPAMRASAGESFIVASDRHVALRAYGEQLLCEANAVIQDPSDHLTLTDEVGGDDLAFSMSVRGHTARVATHFSGGKAMGQIISDDLPGEEAHELVDADALPDLIVRLVMVAGLHNSESAHLI